MSPPRLLPSFIPTPQDGQVIIVLADAVNTDGAAKVDAHTKGKNLL